MDYEDIRQGWLSERFKGVRRDWTAQDVLRLRGPYLIQHSIASWMCKDLWDKLTHGDVRALGALTGCQAIQMVEAGLKGIYLSGWQCAADGNGNMYPDMSLYEVGAVPRLIQSINNALLRQSQITGRSYLIPIIADCEAGFGGALNTYELVLACIKAGAAAVHIEDQLASEKKCGHLGGKVLVPTREMVQKLKAARLAADIAGVDTIIIARTDANSARLLTSDIDEGDLPFIGEWTKDSNVPSQLIKRTQEGFYPISGGLSMAIERGLAYAPWADLLWCETAKPDLGEAKEFAQAIHEEFPDKKLAYNLSPSFNWREHMSDVDARRFQDKLAEMGYCFQFITLAGFHQINHGMFDLAKDYKERGMEAYSLFQSNELESQLDGFRAAKHQAFVGTGYFDSIKEALGGSETTALRGSTEVEQF